MIIPDTSLKKESLCLAASGGRFFFRSQTYHHYDTKLMIGEVSA